MLLYISGKSRLESRPFRHCHAQPGKSLATSRRINATQTQILGKYSYASCDHGVLSANKHEGTGRQPGRQTDRQTAGQADRQIVGACSAWTNHEI